MMAAPSLHAYATPLLHAVRAEMARLQALELALVRVIGAPDLPADVAAPPAPAPVAAVVAPPPAPAAAPAPVSVTVPVAAVPPSAVEVARGVWTSSERRDAIVHLLKGRGPLRVAAIAALLLEAQNRVQDDLLHLQRAGTVTRVDHGTYAYVEVAWSGRQPLVDVESPAFGRKPAC